MLCCANCIADEFFRVEFFAGSNIVGRCSYCNTDNSKLLSPRALKTHFELLLSIYSPAENGLSLVELLQTNWALFPADRLVRSVVKDLLSEILDDGEIVRQKFELPTSNNSDSLLKWKTLHNELKHINRFFPQTKINFDRLEELFGHVLIKEENIPKIWYRARIQQGSAPYAINEMGAPPKTLASHGRANPAGIPYLYLASNELTAISEVRPHTGEDVSVAEYSIINGLKLADLRHPRRTVSPFQLEDEADIHSLLIDIDFLEQLGNELTRPIIPKSAAYDYIPSQYLCEYIKQCGYDGVIYKSSVGNGMNTALFNPEKADCLSVKRVQISRVSVEINTP
ncbi:RES domain-containing protein [Undibacterium amnicola]|uniref:RES domain-containing protein n=1 Tax=Undibacterium amnicola TaxID=1834038 RepID=A0ABR6XVH9_9BURK|nr:RES family NAD+ phosphorylase [Undibacterium amnicola]MBC3833477.1 RES domain-containing protein [Undibacterium amnicola]